MREVIGSDQRHPAKHWHRLADGRIQCNICPRECKLEHGKRGACFVRGRTERGMVLTSYGRATGFRIDPIEQMPLNHFFPGSSKFSFGTAGCSLAAKSSQTRNISTSRNRDQPMDRASPQAIARVAREHGCKSVAFTCNDPVVFFEYALDIADACHQVGLKTVALTAGYMNAAPRREFFARMDAVNIDLKSFSEDFHLKLTGSQLQAIFDTLIYVRYATDCWLEITSRLIPGYNDFGPKVTALARWVARELGPDLPLHFSALRPNWTMKNAPPASPASLARARYLALDAGLHYVYTGTDDITGRATFCPRCNHASVERHGHDIRQYELTVQGTCRRCGERIAGHFGEFRPPFRPRRIPFVMKAHC